MTGVYALRESRFTPAEAALELRTLVDALRNPGPRAHASIASSPLMQAVRHASPAFAQSIDNLMNGSVQATSKRLRAIETTLTRYANRAATRATPFGYFAGVGVSTDPRIFFAISNAEAEARREALGNFDEIQSESRIVTNNTLRKRGTRLEVPELLLGPEGNPLQKSTMSSTPLVEEVVAFCEQAPTWTELDDFISNIRPSATNSVRSSFVQKLLRAQILIQVGRDASMRRMLSTASDTTSLPRRSAPVPQALERKIAQVAQKLFRLPQYRLDAAHRRSYSDRFLGLYGAGVSVPYMTATDPVHGLGLIDTQIPEGPAGPVLNSTQEHTLRQLRLRGTRATDRRVVLTEHDLANLQDAERSTLAADVDIMYSIEPAGSRTEARFGILPVTGVPAQSLGRFWGTMPPVIFEDALKRLDPTGREIEPVELRHLPRQAQSLAVMDSPTLGCRYISVGYDDPEDPLNIPLRDLLLAHDGEKLQIFASGSDIPVRVRNLSMFNYPKLASRDAQLILTLATEPEREWAPFFWGPESRADFLPSVIYRDIALTRAMWNLPSFLLDAGATFADWARNFELWRDVMKLPNEMEFGAADNLLRLSPYDRDSYTEIRRSISPSSPMAFEAPAIDSDTPVAEHIQRVSLKAADAPPTERGIYANLLRHQPSSVAQDWVSIELLGNAQTAPLLTDVTTVLNAARGTESCNWHFVNYNVPDKHLRIRCQVGESASLVRDAIISAAVESVGKEITTFRIVPFIPEVQRYGGTANWPTIVASFTASSEAALEFACSSHALNTERRMSAAVGSAIDIVADLCGEQWQEMLTTCLAATKAQPSTSSLRRAVMRQVSSLEREESQTSQLTWAPGVARTAGIVRSVLHMHANRFFDYDPNSEAAMCSLIRACVQRNVRPQ